VPARVKVPVNGTASKAAAAREVTKATAPVEAEVSAAESLPAG
jgi:hypothetical protein